MYFLWNLAFFPSHNKYSVVSKYTLVCKVVYINIIYLLEFYVSREWSVCYY